MTYPYDLKKNEKEQALLKQLNQLTEWHVNNCAPYAAMIEKSGWQMDVQGLADIPYLPVHLFKLMDLMSVPKEEVVKVGKTRNTAAKLNETVLVEVDDWLDGKQKYELTLTEVISGQEAWSIIEQANMFNEEPDDGMKYVLAKFKVKVHSLEVEPFDINHAKFDAVSKAGSMYNQFFAIVTPTPDLSTDLYTGAEYEGWTYFIVSENDSPKVVYESKRDAEAWFDLGM